MRGTKAKKIRKEIYGDMVSKAEGRTYVEKKPGWDGQSGTVTSVGLRSAYKEAKKQS